jgi:hypothetical protein
MYCLPSFFTFVSCKAAELILYSPEFGALQQPERFKEEPHDHRHCNSEPSRRFR